MLDRIQELECDLDDKRVQLFGAIKQRNELLEALKVLLDQVDYTAGNCSLAEPVAGVLPIEIINLARALIEKHNV